MKSIALHRTTVKDIVHAVGRNAKRTREELDA
jgi:hypothetical protein